MARYSSSGSSNGSSPAASILANSAEIATVRARVSTSNVPSFATVCARARKFDLSRSCASAEARSASACLRSLMSSMMPAYRLCSRLSTERLMRTHVFAPSARR